MTLHMFSSIFWINNSMFIIYINIQHVLVQYFIHFHNPVLMKRDWSVVKNVIFKSWVSLNGVYPFLRVVGIKLCGCEFSESHYISIIEWQTQRMGTQQRWNRHNKRRKEVRKRRKPNSKDSTQSSWNTCAMFNSPDTRKRYKMLERTADLMASETQRV